MNRLTVVPKTTTPLRFSIFTPETYWTCKQPDILGNGWRPPGMYIVAQDTDDTIRTLIRVEIVDAQCANPHDPDTQELLRELLDLVQQFHR